MPHSENSQDEDLVLPDAPSLQNEPSQSQTISQSTIVEDNKENVKLEDMFDDDNEDEYSSSAPPAQIKGEDSSQPMPQSLGRFSDSDVMRAFYQRLFPFRYLFQWLNHSPNPEDTNDFRHREFAFTLQNDVYLRYQSFKTADTLRKQCMDMIPTRFEIGPVYSTNPRERKSLPKSAAFRPLTKELVFDIDMTDYDEIRTCCTGASICHRCWTFITMAIKVVDAALKDDFGFKHIMWVYSGRRGAHAWVCDKRARELDDQKRRAIAGYLELVKGGDKSSKKVNIRRPLHPHLDRSLRILKEFFPTSILADQDPWENPKKAAHLLTLLPDAQLNSALQKKWDSAPSRSSTSKWNDIDTLAESGINPNLDTKKLMQAKQDVILEYTYPRLDAEVSKKLNHLLKSPFCVHPGTGRICVPIDVRRVEEFDPLDVPTVTELLADINSWKKDDSEKKVQDWEKTRLKPYVDFFKGFVSSLLKGEKTSIKRERDGMEY
ncbi:DNA primase small subunit [Patellaria atrata CBS 101060]|uniref:DNA primase n=1 Tax=Patellaria atrata CBS 101060 TaxID=1346257 RepID=A0A9P4S3U7_9PEZI|nr:DNA primase small subunit [Patellaria atrata CBS 101060]